MVDLLERDGLREDQMMELLKNFGYNENLFCERSRQFNMTFHSESEFSVKAQEAIHTGLEGEVNSQILAKYGRIDENLPHYKVVSTFSDETMTYSFGV